MRTINKYADTKERSEYERIKVEYNNHYGVDIFNNEHSCLSSVDEQIMPNIVKDFSYLKKR